MLTWVGLLVALICAVVSALVMRRYLMNREISLASIWSQLQKDGSPLACPDALFFISRAEITNAALFAAHYTPNLSFLYSKVNDEELLVISQNGFRGQIVVKMESNDVCEVLIRRSHEDVGRIPISEFRLAKQVICAVRNQSETS